MMIIPEKPYVSDFLKETIERNNIPVINTQSVKELFPGNSFNIIREQDAIESFKSKKTRLLYTNSENAISWIEDNLSFTDLPEKISFFKNKAKFRRLIQEKYPHYFFLETDFNNIKKIDTQNLKFPVIIKPVTGFFSIAVRRADNAEEWDSVTNEIIQEVEEFQNVYPNVVLNTSSFLIEEYIEGDEFAVDIYYNDEGKLVILNIMKHLFSSGKDVSDRVYISSKEIINTYSNKFREILEFMGEKLILKNFPAHVELRINEKGIVNPIEVNPLRYGGFCTTADFAWYAFGTNTYENFFFQKEPDWETIFKDKENSIFSLIVLDNSTGIPVKDIKRFDHEKLKKTFGNIKEYREIDFKKYKVFGFIFAETHKENIEELYSILHSDLKDFITY